MLDLKRYPKRSPNWYIRGTLKGISVFESTGTSRRPEAEAYLAKRWREIWDSGVLGQRPVATFADAVIAYTNHGGPRRYVTPLLHHFKERPLPEIGQAEIDAAAQALYPETSPATRLRQVYTPMIAILRLAPEHGCAELGHIWYGLSAQRTAVNTEAVFLLLRHLFDDLRYRRVEWKCDALNVRSRAAALRLGFQFEGVFRQHMVVKGQNRDTAWFAMLDGNWPARKRNFEQWVAAEGGLSLSALNGMHGA